LAERPRRRYSMSQFKGSKERIQATSRREFLKRVAKGGSAAALISGGLLDADINKLLAAWSAQKTLSREAIQGPLPTRNLVTIRDLLKGEYYRGGRFYRFSKEGLSYIWGRLGCDPEMAEGKCPEVQACRRFCNGEVNCPWDSSGEGCSGQNCPDNRCDKETCPDAHSCNDHTCAGGVMCGDQASGCYGVYIIYGIGVDSRTLPGFSFQDITKHTTTAFVQDLMKALNIQTAASLEKEVRSMIFERQTLKMRGISY
jgi:hypothetical protein